jgi:hypothetical protein
MSRAAIFDRRLQARTFVRGQFALNWTCERNAPLGRA